VNLWGSLVVALVGGTIAALWPWLQAYQRGWRFQRLIRRELEEIGPRPVDFDEERPWWEHAQKRFVHEAIFHRDSISQNRDFLLSLDPGVVYEVSQLWIALEKRDGHQWMHFLDKLERNRQVRSEGLAEACAQWRAIIESQRDGWLETMGVPTSFRQQAALERVGSLFEKRFEHYSRLLPLTRYGTESAPSELDLKERNALADRLTDWFYADGAGLVLSGRALGQFNRTRETLTLEHVSGGQIRGQLSKLRTDLKIDLGVRQPQERLVAMAWPEEERW
jgi:hypothetical protein